MFQQVSLDGTFDEATSIFQRVINLRPIAQQLPLSQLEEADQFDKPPKEKTLQKVCYDKMMKPSLDAYNFQLQTKADIPGPDQHFAKTMFQNFLDLSNKLSGSWIII